MFKHILIPTDGSPVALKSDSFGRRIRRAVRQWQPSLSGSNASSSCSTPWNARPSCALRRNAAAGRYPLT
jgi:hypothetical protein